jgi:hypothetical protein
MILKEIVIIFHGRDADVVGCQETQRVAWQSMTVIPGQKYMTAIPGQKCGDLEK